MFAERFDRDIMLRRYFWREGGAWCVQCVWAEARLELIQVDASATAQKGKSPEGPRCSYQLNSSKLSYFPKIWAIFESTRTLQQRGIW